MLRALLLAAALLPAAGHISGEEVTYLARDVYFSEGNSSGLCVASAGGRGRLLRTGRYDALAWSPDGRRLAFRRGRYLLVDETSIASARPTWFAWSPDGTLLAYANDFFSPLYAGLWVVRPDGSGRRRIVPANTVVSSATFAPDGRRIFFLRWSYPQPELWSVDLESTERRLEGAVAAPERATLSPDLRTLAYVDDQGAVRVVGRDGSGARTLRTPPAKGSVTWASDSRRIAFTAGGDVHVADTATSAVRRLTRTPRVTEVSPAWRHAGQAPRAKPCVAPPPRAPWR